MPASVHRISNAEAVRTLADFTSQKLIIPSLRGQEATAAIRELGDALYREHRVHDPSTFCELVIRRELRCGTVSEPGWAIPHSLVKNFGAPCFALGRWHDPKIWTNSRRRVNLVFLFAVPEASVEAFNHLVISLGDLSKESQRVEQLLDAGDEIEMLNVLRQTKLHPSSH